jgi:branched-chain amino acid transport system ATP-binding protein
LKERRDQAAGLLSGGQQQMLALGRAIVSEPKLLLLDEMSLGLAPILVKEFYGSLKTLFRDDLTMLIVEQNAKMALSVADYVYVLRNGEIAMEGPSSKFHESEDLLHEGYLGVPVTKA